MQHVELIKDVISMMIYYRCIHGNLLYVMILLIWDGQHLVIFVFTMRNFWGAHSTEILSESG